MIVTILNQEEEEIMTVDMESIPYKVGEKIFITQDVENWEPKRWNDDTKPFSSEYKIKNIYHSIRKKFPHSSNAITETFITTIIVEQC